MQFPTEHSAVKCAGGCGFYGSPATDNFCSVCYKRRLSNRSNNPHSSNTSTSHNASTLQPSPTTTVSPSTLGTSSSPTDTQTLHQPSPATNDESFPPPLDDKFRESQISNSQPTSTLAQIANYDTVNRDTASVEGLSATDSTPVTEQSMAATIATPGVSPIHELDQLKQSRGAVEKETVQSMQPPQQADPSRCYKCNKRVGLLGFKCRCGVICCRPHLHAEEHNCTFNYQEMARHVIETRNPKIVTEKFNRM